MTLTEPVEIPMFHVKHSTLGNHLDKLDDRTEDSLDPPSLAVLTPIEPLTLIEPVEIPMFHVKHPTTQHPTPGNHLDKLDDRTENSLDPPPLAVLTPIEPVEIPSPADRAASR